MSLQHLTFPPRQPVADARAPLLVLVHGFGSNEQDLPGLLPYFDDRLFAISVRAPFSVGPGGFAWYQIAEIGKPDLPTFRESLDRLAQFIGEAIERYPVDPQRVFMLGFSQGATMSFATLLTAPERVAGIIALSGYVPLSTGLPPPDGRLAGRAVFVGHGTRDALIEVSYGREARDFFEPTPVALTYREYPIGHQINAEEIEDIAGWLRTEIDRPRS